MSVMNHSLQKAAEHYTFMVANAEQGACQPPQIHPQRGQQIAEHAAQRGSARGWVPRTEPYMCPACGHRSYRPKVLGNHLGKCCPDLISAQVRPRFRTLSTINTM